MVGSSNSRRSHGLQMRRRDETQKEKDQMIITQF
uniref:Uncharacterized protein n=1 Tax=Romanomermis culicivorax TaxID=13658 RepID=A0A915I0B2_ROMCU